jgi:Ca2+-binding RTX toxin-like protein
VYGTNKKDYIHTEDTKDVIYALNGHDNVYAGAADDTIYGGAGRDRLYGEKGADILYGGNGHDFLSGGTGDDTLDGGGSSDLLKGGAGNDTYIVNSGWDFVVEYYNEGIDTVISSRSYGLRRNVENLTLTGSRNANGYGNRLDNTIIGNSAKNNLKGRSGDDILIGLDGKDRLYGSFGDDILDGGTGNDKLWGGYGSDRYIFGRDYDHDRIKEPGRFGGRQDVLEFSSGILAEQIWFSKSGNHLTASIIGTEDKITITNWFHKRYGQSIEKFELSDGTALVNNQVDALVSAMAQFAPPSMGETTLPDDYQTVLSPVIAASWKA